MNQTLQISKDSGCVLGGTALPDVRSVNHAYP
jgi:hypothetical protein